MPTLILSSSLRPSSRSKKLAQFAQDHLVASGAPSELVDLSEYDLPLCDGDKCYHHPLVKLLKDKTQKASSVIIALPIYNYGPSAALKNYIELVGEALEDKVVGLIVASGGERSYMGSLAIINSLMLEFRCLIVPKFVFVDLTDLTEEPGQVSHEIQARIKELTHTTKLLAKVWKKLRAECEEFDDTP